MALTTRYDGHIRIGDDTDNLVFSTCMLDQTFGSIESFSLKREADREELKRCGGKLLAVFLTNPRFEISFKTKFTADIDAPGLAEQIVFPFAGIVGRIMPPIGVDWEEEGHRMLSIEATSWDSFGNSGAANAQVVTYTNGTPTITDIVPPTP